VASPELREIRDAARDLAQQGQHAPGRARIVFQTVADVALIGTAVISGALASVHLWKALTRTQRETHHGNAPDSATVGGSPPRKRSPDRIAVGGHHYSFDDEAERGR
jgi:hypothetical protein